MSDATTREESDFGRCTEYKLAKLADLLGFTPDVEISGDDVLDEAIEQLERLPKCVGSQMFRSDFKTADEMRAALDEANEVIAVLAAECRAWRTDQIAVRKRMPVTDNHPAARKAVEEAKP